MKSLKVIRRTAAVLWVGTLVVVAVIELSSETAMAQGGGVLPPFQLKTRDLPRAQPHLTPPQGSGVHPSPPPSGTAARRSTT